jgi:DNA-binding MarR family transcriptional regulator
VTGIVGQSLSREPRPLARGPHRDGARGRSATPKAPTLDRYRRRVPVPEFEDPMKWVEHYWRQQHLGDPSKFLAMGSLLRLHQIMTAQVERVLKDFGLTLTGYLVLATVQLSEDGSRLLSRIATHMMVHATTVALTVDKLEKQGLLLRQPHATDRRATRVQITPEGGALVKAASAALEKVGFGMPGLTDTQADQLVAVLAPIRYAAGDIDSTHASADSRPRGPKPR